MNPEPGNGSSPALESPRHRAWLWVTAAATAGLAIVAGLVVSQRMPPPPQQVAQVLKSDVPVASPVAPAPPPVPSPKRKVAPAAAPAVLPGPPPPPPPSAELKKEDNAALADQLQQAKPQAAAGAVREFSALRAPPRFAFNYTVRDGVLEIVPAAPGYLSVTASDAVLFPGSAVGRRDAHSHCDSVRRI